MTRPTRTRAYGQNQPLIDVFPFPVFMTRAPAATDRDFEVGQVWVYNSSPTTRQAYMFGGLDSSGDAIWIITGPGTSEVDALGCDTGDDPVSPGGTGIIDLLGTASQIITTGDDALHKITFSLADELVLVTSVEVPLIIGGDSGSLNIKLGDDAGADAVNILDSNDVTVASISSDGNFSFNNLTVVDLTATGTTQIIGNNSAASSVSLATGTGGNTVNINNGANSSANTVNIAAGAAAAASTVNVLSGVASTGVLALNLNTGTGTPTSRTTNIGTGAAVVNAINIGGTGANVIAIGNTQTAGSFAVGNAMVGATIALGGAPMTGSITLGASTAGQTINMGNAINTGAQIINIAGGASGADSTVNVLSGNGSAGTQTFNVLTGTRAGALNLATGVAAHVVAIGSAGAGAITVDTAAGVSIDSATASNFTVTGAGEDLTLASVGGSVKVNSTENAAGAIALTANGGTSETVTITASQGTGAASVAVSSTAGGVTISGGLATTDAINISAAAGGVDIDGALEINITSSEAAVADAVTISASAADGGITLDAGATPGVTFTNGTQSHRMLVGSGSPNGSVTALQGSLYVDVAGSTSTTILFVNTDGSTTWVGVGA